MPQPQDKILAIGELKTLINSQVLRRILQQRKQYWQQKVNEYVRAQNLISAYGAVSRIDDIDKFVDVLQQEYEKITKEGNNGGK